MKLYYFFFILFFTFGKLEKTFSQENAKHTTYGVVIYANYDFSFYNAVNFIKFQQGLEIGTLRGTYRLGKIEFDKNEYENFLQLNHDSLIMHVNQVNYQDEKVRHIEITDYYFHYDQNFFYSEKVVLIIEDMFFKRARKNFNIRCKEGYAVTYKFNNMTFFKFYNIPCIKK